jgi:putative ABC transport system substrate-binding protein
MKRRHLLQVATTGLPMLLPRGVRAQPAPRRVGVLAVGDTLPELPGLLAELGQLEGRDVVLDRRSAQGRIEAVPKLAAELAAARPFVVITIGPQATQAFLAADATVPVVALLGAAVEGGFVRDLARPGGRLTGVSFLGSTLNGKRLELLAQVLPKGATVLNLGDPTSRTSFVADDLAKFSRSLGLGTREAQAGTPAEIDASFASALRMGVNGVNVLASPLLHTYRKRIIEQAAKARLPAIYQWPTSAHDGGLMAYGPNQRTMYRTLAEMAVQVLKGTRAGDMPMGQPTRFELVINQATARGLGLALPRTLLLRADEVIG